MVVRFWLIAGILFVGLAWVLMVPLSPPPFQASPVTQVEKLRQVGLVPKPGEIGDAEEMEGIFENPDAEEMASTEPTPGMDMPGMTQGSPTAPGGQAEGTMPGMAEGMAMAPGGLRVLDGMMANMAMSTVEIEMREWGFAPASVTIPTGEAVKLVVRNTGNVAHEFMIMPPQDMNAVAYRLARADWNLTEHEAPFERQVVMPGDTFEFVIQADQPGNWMYMCMFPYHMQFGMMGSLATEGAAPMGGMDMGGMKM